MARACARAVPGSSQSYPLIGPSVTVERSVAGSDRSCASRRAGHAGGHLRVANVVRVPTSGVVAVVPRRRSGRTSSTHRPSE